MDASETLGLLRIVQIAEHADPFPGVRTAGTDEHAARVAQTAKVAIDDDVVILAGHERARRPVVLLEGGVAMADANDVVPRTAKRRRSRADDRVGSRGGAAREKEGNALSR